jgi:hypothetical protein
MSISASQSEKIFLALQSGIRRTSDSRKLTLAMISPDVAVQPKGWQLVFQFAM